MIRSGTTAASDHSGTCLYYKFHVSSKLFRCHFVYTLVVHKLRHSGIWLRKYRYERYTFHLFHKLDHLVRSSRTVYSYRRNPKVLKDVYSCNRISSIKCTPIFIEGQTGYNRKLRHFICCYDSCSRLRKTHHRLHYQEITSTFIEHLYLLFVYIYQFFKLKFAHRVEHLTGHGDVSCDKSMSGVFNRFL